MQRATARLRWTCVECRWRTTRSLTTSSRLRLPSHAEQHRWQLSKDLSRFVDKVLATASVASHHINAYTGTDYTGIDALRQEILQQEQHVKNCHQTAEKAKSNHLEALAKQSAGQKEIVGLLERKASWHPSDLDRYMSLVRSEHVLDQAVQSAKEEVDLAERKLEDARSRLERLERKRYHEEQIWSDTIRRNSTWVTFGLMGVNILLLLAQITISEPYRRRKIVQEVKAALDERTVVEKQPDDVQQMAEESPSELALLSADVGAKDPSTMVDQADPHPADEVVEAAQNASAQSISSPDIPSQSISSQLASRWQDCKDTLQDSFSDRVVQMKKVEVTTAVLQGAMTGVLITGIISLIARSR
ncbi:hypothetical protein K470DRAFT_299039 [Piedraia hortae CBS 480.64]|uniref:Sensitive to high expression protein 9, mitochondrial n=1 Tax=Piedraia hortae CBS 480.64 TaxID=1314780 RepID=A0A6A7C420_9PEZI|nr:hypothetical protein K470DRAFT_299039 [Piedraia hortae CBS 480.64]